MSQRLFEDDVIFLQRLLKSSGLYASTIDGIWGPKTDAAVNAFDAAFTAIAARHGVFHSRTEASLRTLQPKAQELMRITLGTIINAGINARIISGTRTYEEQNRLFAQGRFGNPGPVVTKARGGFSNHNFGIACDIGIFTSNGAYLGESPLYGKAGKVTGAASIPNLEWGGNWATFTDRPHYQFHSDFSISQVREKFEKGEPII
jgi:peptidoglycan L-alanyl-D-glutamate endopeptidase CwlK